MTRFVVSVACAFLFFACVIPECGFAASEVWSSRFYPNGVDNLVEASCIYRGHLVIGGSFNYVGGEAIQALAWRYGNGWKPLPGQLRGYVHDVATVNGELVAVGLLWLGGSSDVCTAAVLRKDVWEILLKDSEFSVQTGVKVLADRDGAYIAVGSDYFPALSEPDVYRWNGATIDTLPTSPLRLISDLEWHDEELFAAGMNEERQALVVVWNGTRWDELPLVSNENEYPVTSVQLAEFRGDLVVALDAGLWETTKVVFRWDGTRWVDFGFQFFGFGKDRAASVTDLVEFEDRLIVSGSYHYVDDVPSFGLAAWNGSEWEDLAKDRNATYWPAVSGLSSSKNGLLVFGRFFSIGDIHAKNIAHWDGSAWQAVVDGGLGMAGFAQAFTLYKGDLIAGGVFTHAGNVAASNVARWTGDAWEALGEGLPPYLPKYNSQFVPGIHAFTVYEGDLIAAGQLSGDTFPSDVARWDGTSWQPMGRLQAFLKSLAVYQGELYVGGEFCLPGQDCLIARWNGQDWESIGTGLDSSVTYAGVNAMLPMESQEPPELVLGGWFRSQGARCVAGWREPGLNLYAGGFQGGGVSALCMYQGSIIAAGSLRNDSGPYPVDALARWTGSYWENLAENVDGWPMALADHSGALYVGGDLESVGGLRVSNIAKWNGTWSALDSGVDRQVETLQSVEENLFVGGRFSFAGGFPSQGIAVWGVPAARKMPLKPLVQEKDGGRVFRSGVFQVSFSLPRSQATEMNVYDISGRLVARIVSGDLSEGRHTAAWDGRTTNGLQAPAGIYFLRLRSEDVVRVWRAVKLP